MGLTSFVRDVWLFSARTINRLQSRAMMGVHDGGNYHHLGFTCVERLSCYSTSSVATASCPAAQQQSGLTHGGAVYSSTPRGNNTPDDHPSLMRATPSVRFLTTRGGECPET